MRIEQRWIPGFEGRYQVGTNGIVISAPRRYAHGGMLTPRHTRYNGEPPYEVVRLYPGDGTFVDKLVHIAVLETFVGPRPEGMEARHLDGNALNNRLDNLAWGTHEENMADKLVHGTDGQRRKTHCPQGHEYTKENTYIGKTKAGGESRTCRRCRADREAARRAKVDPCQE